MLIAISLFGLFNKYIICRILLQKHNVSIDVIVMGEGSEETAIDAIHAAEREDTWLVIDQLHLTSDSFFKQLGYHLHRIAKSNSKFFLVDN